MRTIEEIIEAWKAEFGTLAQGQWGPYRFIDFKSNRELVLNLVQTLKDEGYPEADLAGARVQLKVVDACEAPPGKSARKASSIRTTKNMTASNWRWALVEVYRGKVSTYVPPAQEIADIVETIFPLEIKPELSKEELLEKIMSPKDRIVSTQKIDRSNDTNWELMEELGMDPDEEDNE